MNERINELRLDAGISRLHDEPYFVAVTKSGEIEDPMIGLEKFAQLIVRECIKQARKDENGPAYEAVGRIAEHFGVE